MVSAPSASQWPFDARAEPFAVPTPFVIPIRIRLFPYALMLDTWPVPAPSPSMLSIGNERL
jgi:hypothetical protein